MPTAKEIDEINKEQILRNPSIDFTAVPNLATQTGAKTIPQLISEFERAGRAIMVSEADANFPETPGMRLYPDPIEAILLEREVDAELLIARRRLAEDQRQAETNAKAQAEKNQQQLERIQATVEAAKKETPQGSVT